MKQKYLLLLLNLAIIFLISCGNLDNMTDTSKTTDSIDTQSSEELTENDTITTSSDVTMYEGLWTKDGLLEMEISGLGGSILELCIEEDGSLSGVYSCIEKVSYNTATIKFDELSADNSYITAFEDDGFGNSGTLTLSLMENSVEVIISIDEDQTNGDVEWCVESNILVRPLNHDSRQSGESDLSRSLINYLESILRTDMPYYEKIFESDTRYYTIDELESLSDDILSIFKNEIYARHGMEFSDEEIANLFHQFNWYIIGDFNESELNEYEAENLSLAIQVEEEKGYR